MEARWMLQPLDIFFEPKWLASRNDDLKSNVSTHFTSTADLSGSFLARRVFARLSAAASLSLPFKLRHN